MLRYWRLSRSLKHRLAAAVLAAVVVTTGCSSSPASQTREKLHVVGPVTRASPGRCLFALRAAVREGGTQRTCLTAIDGFPAPNATMHSRGTMRFARARGAMVFRVRVTQRFAADGAHARQSVAGTIVSASGRYSGARGSISGGGTVVDTRDTIRIGQLTYRLSYRR
jgi:hypothetical protein